MEGLTHVNKQVIRTYELFAFCLTNDINWNSSELAKRRIGKPSRAVIKIVKTATKPKMLTVFYSPSYTGQEQLERGLTTHA
jgi:hypothetical protein